MPAVFVLEIPNIVNIFANALMIVVEDISFNFAITG